MDLHEWDSFVGDCPIKMMDTYLIPLPKCRVSHMLNIRFAVNSNYLICFLGDCPIKMMDTYHTITQVSSVSYENFTDLEESINIACSNHYHISL